MPRFSVIICSNDRAKFDDACDNYRRLIAKDDLEIIGIHDAKSLAEGYNRGIESSRGELLIFAHDDARIHSPDLSRQLAFYGKQFDVFGVAGTSKLVYSTWATAGPPFLFGQLAHLLRSENAYLVCIYGVPNRSIGSMQALDGVFIAARRDVAQTLRFDQDSFDGFHLYDIDFSFRAHLAGYKVGVCCDLGLFHASGGTTGPGDPEHRRLTEIFLRKHAGKLPPAQPRNFEFTWIRVPTVEEAMVRMTPLHWRAAGW